MAGNSVFPAVPGYNGLGANTIPAHYSEMFNDKFYAACVLAYIANSKFEGEVRDFGDKVYVRNIPDINIFKYYKGMKLEYQRPKKDSSELIVDHGFGFACALDKVEQVQSNMNEFSVWADDATHQIKIAVEQEVFADLPAMVDPQNQGTTAGQFSDINLGAKNAAVPITKNNVLDYILDCGTVLDEKNISPQDRWVVIPAWLAGMVKKSDLAKVYVSGDETSILRSGNIGTIDTFNVFVSNLLPTSLDNGVRGYNVLFGHKSALTFAGQATNMEYLTGESFYGQAIRGLQVFGYNVIKPEAMGVLYCTK